jgi:ABC-type branched-subunit amino acid transport system permease subunit
MKIKRSFRIAIVLFVVGVVLRLLAQRIAWPTDYEFGGSRSDTSWAHQEVAYTQVSFALMILGAAMLIVTVNRWLTCDGSADKQR